jgi:endonuclease YncB( thermonuclease family)
MWVVLLLLLSTAAVTEVSAQESRPVRDVTPPGVTRVFRAADARTPIDDLQRFAQVRLDPKGILWAESQKLDLHGVALPDPKRICQAPSGGRWMCGQRAVGALRAVVQSGPIACRKSPNADSAAWRCQTNSISDIGLWLLLEGHADLAAGVADKSYVEAAATAKARQIGLWAGRVP